MRGLPAFIAAAAVAACASDAERAEAPKNAVPQGEAYVLEALDEPALPKGECGMVLWTLDEDRPAPIFRYVAGKSAEIKLDGDTLELQRSESDGAAGFGVFERQTFRSAAGVVVNVETRFSLGFDGGSYLERGVVAVESPNGWRSVSPAAGLAGCRAK